MMKRCRPDIMAPANEALAPEPSSPEAGLTEQGETETAPENQIRPYYRAMAHWLEALSRPAKETAKRPDK